MLLNRYHQPQTSLMPANYATPRYMPQSDPYRGVKRDTGDNNVMPRSSSKQPLKIEKHPNHLPAITYETQKKLLPLRNRARLDTTAPSL